MTGNTQPEALEFCWATELAMTQQPVTLSVTEAREVSAKMQRLHAENTTLQQGYAAARLEIESLQARIKTMAEEHADELMLAHLDGRMRAAQPAGAQQPGTAYAALPDADHDYMRKVVAVAVTMLFDGYKEDVTRVFSTGELSEFVTITAAMGGERVEDIYRRAWDLLSIPVRASHWQAPVCAAPDVSGYVSEWSGGLCTSDEAMDGIAKLYAAQPAGAQQPCPTCTALARTVMLDQVSFDRKPDCYGIRQITDDEGVEEWEDIRTSPDVAREEANDMMATGRGEIYEVVPLWTTPQPTQPQAGAVPLTKEQRNRIVLTADTVSEAIDMVERHHGIKGGQHGTE